MTPAYCTALIVVSSCLHLCDQNEGDEAAVARLAAEQSALETEFKEVEVLLQKLFVLFTSTDGCE